MGATKRDRGVANGSAKRVADEAAKTVSSEAAGNGADQPGKFFDPMAVTWMEKYNAPMEKFWSRLPSFIRSTVVTLAVFILGATMRGEWLLTAVYTARYFGWDLDGQSEGWDFTWQNLTLEALHLKNVRVFWFAAASVSYLMYFGIGGFLHWYFYVRQRDRPEEWKIQPTKFLSPELERHEILLGSFTLLITSCFTGTIACYISNGGWSRVYYGFDEYGWTWWFLQWPVIFIYQDYATYWLHRVYHTPFLYKHFHKLHHKYKQPTAFSVTAMHPVELVHIQITLCVPLFVIPCHFVPFSVLALYSYYYGIIDHSGVNFKAAWWQPWQPGAVFHDNHHQYFHVNFAFNIYYWDKLHGTYRQKDRLYTEDTFYGHGKALSEATEQERQQDLAERLSENPLAYPSNTLEYKLDEAEDKARKRVAVH